MCEPLPKLTPVEELILESDLSRGLMLGLRLDIERDIERLSSRPGGGPPSEATALGIRSFGNAQHTQTKGGETAVFTVSAN